MSDLVVPLKSKGRDIRLLFPKLQHALPAVALLLQGLDRVRHESHAWSRVLGVAEVATSVLVIGAFVRLVHATRQGRHADHPAAAHHGVDWVDLCIGAMLAVEVWAHWHETGHVKRPTVLLAAVMLGLGMLHGRIAGWAQRRRSLRVTDEGIHASQRPFSQFRATWAELAAIEIEPGRARLIRRDGRVYVLDLADLHHAADVRQALEGARLRLPAPEPPAAADLVEGEPPVSG